MSYKHREEYEIVVDLKYHRIRLISIGEVISYEIEKTNNNNKTYIDSSAKIIVALFGKLEKRCNHSFK